MAAVRVNGPNFGLAETSRVDHINLFSPGGNKYFFYGWGGGGGGGHCPPADITSLVRLALRNHLYVPYDFEKTSLSYLVVDIIDNQLNDML